MSDVLTITDLETAKKHDTFHSEVITGKAGGVSTGADIDYATSKVTGQTQKTLPKVLRDLGMMVQTWTATTGGTLTDASQVFLNDITASAGKGNYYAWTGSLPKVVAAGTDPAAVAGFVARSDAALRSELGDFVARVNTPTDIASTQKIGTTVETLSRYGGAQGGGRYIITAGTSPYPSVDPQVAPDRYAKLLPLPGTNYGYSLLQAGGKNNLDPSTTTSRVINQLLAKIYAESPLIGGLIHAEGGQYYLAEAVVRPTAGAKHLGVIGERSNNSYGTYESRTVFYFDDGLVGTVAMDFFDTQFMTFSDFAMRGQSLKGGLRLGKDGSYVPGFGGHLLERIQATYCTDGILLRNGGACTLRDIQVAENFNRGLALESSGDTNLYNVYANGNNKDTADSSLTKGVGLYIGVGSNNTNIFGGKLEFNSKGLVVHGSNGVNYVGLQFDYNSMANLVVSAIDDAVNACRGNHATGCRFLSGGVVAGLQKAGIYLDSALGSVALSITGGGIQAAGSGAYDTSTAGVIGPKNGIYANGNNTYSLDVIGGDMLLSYPGVDYAVVATGTGTTVKLNGTGGKKTSLEANGAKVHVGFNSKQASSLALIGSSGSATYSIASYDCEVIDGYASVDMQIALSSVGSLAGDISITGIPYINTSTAQASVAFGMVAGLSYDLFGYILPGESNVILWKKTGGGGISRLTASDLTNLTLIRASVKIKVS